MFTDDRPQGEEGHVDGKPKGDQEGSLAGHHQRQGENQETNDGQASHSQIRYLRA